MRIKLSLLLHTEKPVILGELPKKSYYKEDRVLPFRKQNKQKQIGLISTRSITTPNIKRTNYHHSKYRTEGVVPITTSNTERIIIITPNIEKM